MGKIVLLDDLTINKIAAGEVIERPASVVKEVVENSIDAGATNISVEIKNGGISYIRITDNGKGIEKDDLEIAFERHATSKIRNADDLETVKSMGFRGEALASISAIARVELITKTEEETIGHKIVVEGGKILTKEEIGCPKGTSITIENLFYNTPVRYKFLKKDFTESGYVEDVVGRIALVNPNIAIKFVNSGKTILQTSGNGELNDIIYAIYGKDVSENVINVEYYFEDMVIKGVIGKPKIARSNRSNQVFFVNKRYVKNSTLTSAVEQAYKGTLPVGKFSFLVLNAEIDPHKLDVNVHPAKLEVRFQDENKVFKLVYHAIKEALIKGKVIEDAEENKENNSQEHKNNEYLENIDDLEKEQEKILNMIKNESKATENANIQSTENTKISEEVKPKEDNTNIDNGESILQKEETKTDDFNQNNTTEDTEKLELDIELDNKPKVDLDSVETPTKSSVNLERLIRELDENLAELSKKSEEYLNSVDEEEAVEEEKKEELKVPPVETEQDANEEYKADTNYVQEVEEVKEDNDNLLVETKETNNSVPEEHTTPNTEEKYETEPDVLPKTFMHIYSPNEVLQQDYITKTNNTEQPKTAAEEGTSEVQDFEEERMQLPSYLKNNTKQNTTIHNTAEIGADIKNDETKASTSETNAEASTESKAKEPVTEKEQEINFEKMYEKMFGINISNRNKVKEEKDEYSTIKEEDYKTVENLSMFSNGPENNRPAYKFIGMAFDTYIIIEYQKEMYLINQHSANERIVYERMKKSYFSTKNKDKQFMLLPDIINLNEKEIGIVKDNRQVLTKAGFEFEDFGENTIKLVSVPGICFELDTKELFVKILREINKVARNDRNEIEEKLFHTIATAVADETKMVFTAKEVDKLITSLLSFPKPFESPEGSPTAVRMSRQEIEKKFSRRK